MPNMSIYQSSDDSSPEEIVKNYLLGLLYIVHGSRGINDNISDQESNKHSSIIRKNREFFLKKFKKHDERIKAINDEIRTFVTRTDNQAISDEEFARLNRVRRLERSGNPSGAEEPSLQEDLNAVKEIAIDEIEAVRDHEKTARDHDLDKIIQSETEEEYSQWIKTDGEYDAHMGSSEHFESLTKQDQKLQEMKLQEQKLLQEMKLQEQKLLQEMKLQEQELLQELKKKSKLYLQHLKSKSQYPSGLRSIKINIVEQLANATDLNTFDGVFNDPNNQIQLKARRNTLTTKFLKEMAIALTRLTGKKRATALREKLFSPLAVRGQAFVSDVDELRQKRQKK